MNIFEYFIARNFNFNSHIFIRVYPRALTLLIITQVIVHKQQR